MKKLLSITALLFSSATFGSGYWLNIPAHYDAITKQFIPSTSLYTSTHELCSDAIVQYAKMEYVYYVGCDVKPLPDAVNIPKRRR